MLNGSRSYVCDGSQRWQLSDGVAMSTDAVIDSRTPGEGFNK
jgi:hypothetical protein